MLFLGFSAGLPLPLVFATLSAWLATAGVSKATIGMFAWIGITYSLKFTWAPFVDRLSLTLLDRLLGRRRSWMLVAQLGLVAALLAMSGADPASDLGLVAWLALAVAFSSATQDIVIDAYRIEAVQAEVQGAMAATYQFGYRVAMLASGAGALFIADLWSWSAAYRAMAALVLVGVATVLVIDEPVSQRAGHSTAGSRASSVERLTLWLATAVVGPFADFFRRNGGWAIVLLGFIASYRISDLILGVMANPFYIDIGFSLSQIAAIAKVFGFGMTLLGAALGGLAVARYGVTRPLVGGALLVASTNLLFAWLANQGPQLSILTLTISADNLAAGFAGTVFIAYLSSLTSVAYTATQYALFSALMTLLGNFIGGFSGRVVEASDWVSFFLYASAMGIPAILLSVVVARRGVAK
ncbi:MAG: AmpG family muropeptide MFS transporter [Gammaproteobacteria bacterium]|nr:AmpG family muropeptide MFS transporter [Gammaproteobacteria bacterium]